MFSIAVIDIGTTSIRMTVAIVEPDGAARPLEFLQQAVSLGKDTFTKGYIERGTIEECVHCLKNFRRVLLEYGITREDRVRAVATTAVREAQNRDAFIDRVYIATGLRIETLDDMDVARLTYLSARSLLKRDPMLSRGQIVICEMGGGSIEMLLMAKGNIVATHSFRPGALRLREVLEKFHAPLARQRTLMENEIRRAIAQILHSVPPAAIKTMIALGGDMRIAANRLIPDYNPLVPTRVLLGALEKFTEETLSLSVNDCVRKYKIPFPDAETLSPALLFYCMLGRAFSLKSLVVSDISMRHGILLEMAKAEPSGDDFARQIIRSAWEVAKKYGVEESHARHVVSLSAALFASLKEEHLLGPWYGLLLSVAGILHDAGVFISARSHHKHSMYLIQNSELFGLSRRDILLVALIARYHRRAAPKPEHREYADLDREGRLAVAKLAAILRVADALDRSHSQRIAGIECRREKDRFVIAVPNADDLTLEQLALQNKGDMFEDVYGMSVAVEKKPDKSS
ncbi:MAG TPA: Ppx/GppA phosphatase family protein [Chitinivibrionales bacterium]|nr:Ppx/GppA phosphatase family protein [Chitinivibrionales bacterium]